MSALDAALIAWVLRLFERRARLACVLAHMCICCVLVHSCVCICMSAFVCLRACMCMHKPTCTTSKDADKAGEAV